VAWEIKVALCRYEVVYLFREVVSSCSRDAYPAPKLLRGVALKLPSATVKLTPAVIKLPTTIVELPAERRREKS
jgi:hypothetical protein